MAGARTISAVLFALVLPGCAAAIPAAAIALYGGDRALDERDERRFVDPPEARSILMRAAAISTNPREPELAAPQAAGASPLQSAAVSPVGGPLIVAPLSTWSAVSAFVAASASARVRFGSNGAGEGCGGKPRALVIDIDEGEAVDDQWEAAATGRIVAAPGAREAVAAARAAGLTVIFSSDRAADSAIYSEVALDFARLGPVATGETLWLRAEGESRAARHRAIAARYCVIGVAGDDPDDFEPDAAAAWPQEAEQLWGRGWFRVPTAVTVEPASTLPPSPPAQTPLNED